MLTVSATDNNGSVTLTKTWSDGALDKCGGLTAGEHTWTITASDVFDNTATKIITFIVTENEPTYSLITDEANLFGDYTVTFDGVNSVIVSHGLKIKKPADPVKETTAEATYEFIGWYVGDTQWDFENDVVMGNLNLESKWAATPRSYTVSFDGEEIAQKVEYGSVIPTDAIPDDPIKEATSRKEFTFAGWYLGDKLWNFETDVITGDTALVAKFTETARLYTVTFDGENAQQYEYGAKIAKPENPVKEPTATVRYEFIGWFYLGKEWNFDMDIVNYNIKLQSKWKEIAIEDVKPDNSTGSNDSTQQGNQSNDEGTRAGCGGIIDGAAITMLALGSAVTVLLKKKEN